MRTRVLLFVTAVLWSGSLRGQTFSANLTGIVTDAARSDRAGSGSGVEGSSDKRRP